MTSDNSDRTVFRQSTPHTDHTVVRPMPGGRGSTQVTATVQPQTDTPPVAAPTAHYVEQVAMAADSGAFMAAGGVNPLVSAANTLIAVFAKTRRSLSHPNVGGLHQNLVNEIRHFEQALREMSYKPEIVLSARYVLCVALDEAVLNTPWGSESAWPQRTLLSLFHNETAGGEKFFQILERMKQQPAENMHMLELMYLLLSLGFEGKYRMIDRGRERLEQLKDEQFDLIRRLRGEYERSLSPNWKGLGETRNSLIHYLPMWVIATLVVGALVLGYSGFRYWLYHSSRPVVEQLVLIQNDASHPNASANRGLPVREQ